MQKMDGIITSKELHIAQYVEGRGLMRAFGVYCQVQGFFDIARRQSGGRAGHVTGHQRRLVQYPRESDFVLSFSLLLFFLLPVPVANYFATKSPGNEETPQPTTLPLVVSQRFVISITRYLSSLYTRVVWRRIAFRAVALFLKVF